MLDKEIVIVGGARTPFGKFGGGLKDLTATDLAYLASKEALHRSAVKPEEIDHVIFGNVMQTSADAPYLARHVGLRCEVPIPVPAYIVNRLCGSGFQAVINGAQEILLGNADEVLVGGTEAMSMAPHNVRGARWGLKLGQAPMEDSLWATLTDSYCGASMAMTAENLAAQYEVSREEADEYAYRSHMLAHQAWEEGHMQEEVVAVEVPGKKGMVRIERDEHIRPETNLESLAKLKPVFKMDGQVTAANSSGINDGAAALVLTTAASAKSREVKPLGRLIAWAVKGVQPDIMGIGPAPASREALHRAGLKLEEMDLVEVNEAFASQYLAVERELGLVREKTNINGGAIALGHPLGASGARITLSLLYSLRRHKLRYGLASACIGGGQGIALIVESFNH
ncbi:MAG: acetyl-CoA C-acetyltransferase [Vulcanimicrobiota bacterium]